MKNLSKLFGVIAISMVTIFSFAGCENVGDPREYPTIIPIEWRGTWTNSEGSNNYTLYLTATTARVTGNGANGDANGITYDLNTQVGYHIVHGFFFGSDENSGSNRNMINLGRIDPTRPYVGVAGFGTRLGALAYIRIPGNWVKQ